ncbi:hypothetical protein ACFYW6_31200 [Streptomyces sp. NPDC002659]|uniref:hypothetical protein n=1 Tax=Streptomyces sp. NPDC002659 TaxID=3364656 RepID=UPI003693DD2E
MLMMMLGLTFVSSAFVPTEGMPALAARGSELEPAQRAVGRDPEPVRKSESREHGGRPAVQHAVLATVVYSLGMIVAFAPLAVRLYRTRTSN